MPVSDCCFLVILIIILSGDAVVSGMVSKLCGLTGEEEAAAMEGKELPEDETKHVKSEDSDEIEEDL